MTRYRGMVAVGASADHYRPQAGRCGRAMGAAREGATIVVESDATGV